MKSVDKNASPSFVEIKKKDKLKASLTIVRIRSYLYGVMVDMIHTYTPLIDIHYTATTPVGLGKE